MMRARSRGWWSRLAVVASLPLLAGCPSFYGFRGRVVAPKDVNGAVKVMATEPTHEGAVADVKPIKDAKVTCDGCGDSRIELDADGAFFLRLDTGYSSSPIVLHVTAPGYAPMDIDVKEPPHDTQLGYSLFVIVMKPETPKSP